MTKGPLQGREQAVRLAERCKEKNTVAERPAENPLQLEALKPLHYGTEIGQIETKPLLPFHLVNFHPI